MRDMSIEPTHTVVRAKSDADLLAMVPALLGMLPEHSLVLVMFDRTRSVGAARIDLPSRRTTRELRAVADLCVNLASRSRGVDRVATIVYTDATFEAEGGIPWIELTRVIELRMHRAGFGVSAQHCIAADGWGNALATGHGRGPRPLSEIPRSEGARLVAHLDVDDPREWGILPKAEPRIARELDDLVVLTTQRWHETRVADPDWIDVISLADADALHHEIEAIVSDPALPLVAADLATLAAYASLPSWRDTIMLQIAFGLEIGRRAADGHRFWNEQRRIHGGSMDDAVAASMAGARNVVREDADMLGGLITGESQRRPDLDRCRTAIAALLRTASNVESELRPGLLCMAAWLSWAIGRSSAAHVIVGQVRHIDPSHRMSQIVASLVGSGRVPEWMFSEDEGSVDHPASPHRAR